MNEYMRDKTIVITGANRGIGLEIAKAVSSLGGNIIACVRDANSMMESGLDEINSSSGGALNIYELDLNNLDSVRETAKKICQVNKEVHGLVNNAGVASGGLFQMTEIAELKQVFDINFFHQLVFTQYISRRMGKSVQGSIVNIASASAFRKDRGSLAYSASKAALVQATRVMSTELAGSNIRVNAVAPGVTNTDMLALMSAEAIKAQVEASVWKKHTQSSEIASVVKFLLSDEAMNVSGQVIRVDGGQL